MASLDLPTQSTKRQRREDQSDAHVKRSEIWYNDGSVVLQALRGTQFRVHWGILAQHSPYFRKLQVRLQVKPTDENKEVDGCRIVCLPAKDADVEELLSLLYRPTYKKEPSFTLLALASLIRIAREYEFADILDLAVRHVSSLCPTTLAGYDELFYASGIQTVFPEGRAAAVEPGQYFEIVALAQENRLHFLLPCAFLRLIMENSTEVLFRSVAAVIHPKLALADLQTLLVGRDELLNVQWGVDKKYGMLQRNTSQCRLPECRYYSLFAFRDVAKMPFSFKHALSPTIESRFAKMLCETCAADLEAGVQDGRAKLWEALPAMFGLVDWDELRKGAPAD